MTANLSIIYASPFIYVLLPWCVLYLSFEFFGPLPRSTNISFDFEKHIPIMQWSEMIYILAYPLVIITPFFLKTKRDVREFMITSWVTNGLGFFMFLTVPFIFAARDFTASNLCGELMLFERTGDTPATAFPAMHVSWAIICAYFLTRNSAHLCVKIFASILAIAISLSCLTVGLHCILDIVSGVIIALAGLYAKDIWRFMVRICEKTANSWREFMIGNFRIINHGFWVALGAFLGTFIMGGIIGKDHSSFILIFAFVTMFCAGAWGQYLEGSSKLSRPFGFYGGLFGASAVVLFYGLNYGIFWTLALAGVIAAPLIQMLGRMRCLVQGCCHGAECSCEGIVYTHPYSRVLRIAELGGKKTYPTQLYSMVGNFFIFILLIRFWSMGAQASFIVGAFFILSSLQRFVEESYRGEPQTKSFFKLKIYQWLGILFFTLGIFISNMPSAEIQFKFDAGLREFLYALIIGFFIFIIMACDFPKSNKRFSRLT